MKVFTAVALAALLSSGVAFAQSDSDGGTGGNDGGAQQGSGTDSGNYMTGPNIQRFYTDESMTTMRSEAEMRSTWEGMSESERAEAKKACAGNKDNRFNPLCSAIGNM